MDYNDRMGSDITFSLPGDLRRIVTTFGGTRPDQDVFFMGKSGSATGCDVDSESCFRSSNPSIIR
jgi:hypothetical protein